MSSSSSSSSKKSGGDHEENTNDAPVDAKVMLANAKQLVQDDQLETLYKTEVAEWLDATFPLMKHVLMDRIEQALQGHYMDDDTSSNIVFDLPLFALGDHGWLDDLGHHMITDVVNELGLGSMFDEILCEDGLCCGVCYVVLKFTQELKTKYPRTGEPVECSCALCQPITTMEQCNNETI